ncbi:hypothetical protein [Streptomyces corynorhini]|uniref:Secreted protein n=1 Tax=Streptomyces corynorhini TaxID=2282652 RepID=A0A370B541_9ACTN|nr:hypothetical protein [Streptomyces corynorhini]RDG35489.1 hypothetical protein DVH02_25120 [Streptomyces corynorhini]
MRTRTALVAALGALTLLVSAAGSASAAEGEFGYVYTGLDGLPHDGVLVNPPDWVCVTLPEAAGEYVPPADSPRNGTDSRATLFTGPDCDGARYTLAPGGSASSRLKLRSVRFTPAFSQP